MYPSTKTTALYANETFTSFFRRLTFSPDGSLLFTPAGQHKEQHHPTTEPARQAEEMANMTYIYTRAGLNKPPVAKLPGHKKPSLAIKCSPVFYTLRTGTAPTKEITIDTRSEDDIPSLPEPALLSKSTPSYSAMDPPPIAPSPAPSAAAAPSPRSVDADRSGTPGPASGPLPVFDLPYRMVYAVATQDAIHVYDTQQAKPICVVSNLHYATFTDLSWLALLPHFLLVLTLLTLYRSNDGLTLLITSSDGFCSCLTFAPGELGGLYLPPPHTKHVPAAFHMAGSPAASTPGPTPGYNAPPPLTRQPSSQGANPSPSPFTMGQPASPARSVSNASQFTLASNAPATGQDVDPLQFDTPQISAMPGLTAANSGPPTVGGVPMYTPPQTPGYSAAIPAMSALYPHSLSSSVPSTEKRETDLPEERGRDKRRRIAPTPVLDHNTSVPTGSIAPPPVPTSRSPENEKPDQNPK